MLMIYLIRGYYPKYISSLYDLPPKKGKKKKNPVKKWAKNLTIDTSPKRTYRGP